MQPRSAMRTILVLGALSLGAGCGTTHGSAVAGTTEPNYQYRAIHQTPAPPPPPMDRSLTPKAAAGPP